MHCIYNIGCYVECIHTICFIVSLEPIDYNISFRNSNILMYTCILVYTCCHFHQKRIIMNVAPVCMKPKQNQERRALLFGLMCAFPLERDFT